MKIVDLREMPGFNDSVSNGQMSVSSGKVLLEQYVGRMYPSCRRHGAMNKVSSDGIWRCTMCNEGCYQVGG
jgi:ribosomal protein L37AE/L43A